MPKFLLATALCAAIALGATLLEHVEAQQVPQEPRTQTTTAEQGWANCMIQLGRLGDASVASNGRIAALEKQLTDEKSHLKWVLENWVPGPAKPTVPSPGTNGAGAGDMHTAPPSVPGH